MILEWIKGHETMAEENHNWISKLKMQGNQIADREAKIAAEEEKTDIDFQLEHRLTFRHRISGVRVSLKGLLQWCKEKYKIERSKRLQQPADESKSKHGQGVYMTVANNKRTLITSQQENKGGI